MLNRVPSRRDNGASGASSFGFFIGDCFSEFIVWPTRIGVRTLPFQSFFCKGVNRICSNRNFNWPSSGLYSLTMFFNTSRAGDQTETNNGPVLSHVTIVATSFLPSPLLGIRNQCLPGNIRRSTAPLASHHLTPHAH